MVSQLTSPTIRSVCSNHGSKKQTVHVTPRESHLAMAEPKWFNQPQAGHIDNKSRFNLILVENVTILNYTQGRDPSL